MANPLNAPLQVRVWSILPEIVDAVHDGGTRLVDEWALVAYQVSQELVPVDTSKLKDEAYIDEPDDRTRRVVYAAKNAYGDAYGPFQEYGTVNHGAQPFLGPAAEEARRHVEGSANLLVGFG